ncbi:unnamed protein product, partial [Meganyctiphanes norvegica]
MSDWIEKPIKGVLLDITGVLYESGEGLGTVIPGSVEAIARLKECGVPVRLVTNETCATREAVVDKLQHHGYNVTVEQIFSPVPAVLSVLKERKLIPHLLVHPAVENEFKSLLSSRENRGTPTCVVMGDADEGFSFVNMNDAFLALMAMDKPVLFSLGKGKYYKHKGQLQLDVGSFAAALEFACDIQAEVVGKPSPQFFGAALADMGITADQAVMVGDDIVSDVGGAQKCGIRGVLVRTGKYTPKCENHPTVKPNFIADNLANAVDLIVSCLKQI